MFKISTKKLLIDTKRCWIYIVKEKGKKLHFCVILYGSLSKALLSLDTAFVSKLHIGRLGIHSLLYKSFTKITKSEGVDQCCI